MELKPGYKQTEVGVIPEDWDVRTVGDIAIVGSGGTPNRKNPDFWDGDIPWITTAQIDGGEIKNAEQYITKSGLESSAAKWYLKGTILMAMYGQGKTRGKTAILGIDATINQACAAITVSDRINKKYLLHYLIGCYDKIRELSNSGGQENLNSNIVKSITVIVPTKTEQTAIANALSDADALIQSLTRLIVKKRQIKQGAMQTLLNPYENGRLKAGWVVKKLGEAVTFRNGKAHEQLIDEHGEFIVVNSKFISTEGKIFKNALLALEQLNKNDVVMVMSDIPNGKALAKCFIVPENNRYTLNQRICALNSESINDIYLALILNRNKYFLSFDSGTGQTNLKKSDVLNCPIYYPKSENEQTRIATILSGMDAEIAELETKLAKYRHIKQGMMQNLLTGRIRLVKPESNTGAVA